MVDVPRLWSEMFDVIGARLWALNISAGQSGWVLKC